MRYIVQNNKNYINFESFINVPFITHSSKLFRHENAFQWKFLKILHCLNNAYIDNETYSSPSWCVWHPWKHIPRGAKNSTSLVHWRNNRVYKAYKKQYSINPFGSTAIEGGTRPVDRMMEEKNKRSEEVITLTELHITVARSGELSFKNLSNNPTTSTPNTHQQAMHHV